MATTASNATLLRCHEPDELLSIIPGVAYRAVPAKAGPFRVSLASFKLDDLVFQTGECSPMLAMANVLPSGMSFIQIPFSGLDGFILNGRPIEECSVAFYGERGGFERTSNQETRHLAIGLPVDIAADRLSLRSSSSLLRPGSYGICRVSKGSWAGIIRLARAAYEQAWSNTVFHQEESRRSLRASILQASYELLDDARETEAELRLARSEAERQRVIRSADAFLRANRSRAIYTEDLSAALSVPAARIADAFRSTFGISPHRFLKLRRLAMVRAALRGRDETGTIPLVKTAALSHGFWHLGQFSRDYKAQYGELPSDTRARTLS